jgi:hypothetical protein
MSHFWSEIATLAVYVGLNLLAFYITVRDAYPNYYSADDE